MSKTKPIQFLHERGRRLVEMAIGGVNFYVHSVTLSSRRLTITKFSYFNFSVVSVRRMNLLWNYTKSIFLICNIVPTLYLSSKKAILKVNL